YSSSLHDALPLTTFKLKRKRGPSQNHKLGKIDKIGANKNQIKIMRWIIMGWIGVSVFASDLLFAQGSSLERRQQYLKEVLEINIDQLFRANTRRISVQ